MRFLVFFIVFFATEAGKNVLADSDESEQLEICQADGFDRCVSDDECCSEFCEKGDNEKVGVCAPICGKPGIKVDASSDLNRSQSEVPQFPWHAIIYEYNTTTSTYDQSCGGTLISHTVVVTAASYVTTEENRTIYIEDLSSLRVALGKIYRTYDAPEDRAQIFYIESIEVHPEYAGKQYRYDNNIAIIRLKTPVKYTVAIRPACLDIGLNDFENQQLIKGAVGKVPSWKYDLKKRTTSKSLKPIQMPFVPLNECKKNASRLTRPYVTKNSICAGDKFSNETAVCTYDGGAGLVFKYRKTKAYYLSGIVNLGSKGCKEDFFFTKLSSYKNFINKYVGGCKRVCKMCGRPVTKDEQRIGPSINAKENIEFPWNAEIYEYRHNANTSSYYQICKGTLISNTVVVSAAYCFTTDEEQKVKLNDFSRLKVALGKYYRAWNASEDIWAQIFEIENIELHSEYEGIVDYHAHSIAFVTLKTPVKYTVAVRPACLDIGLNSFENRQLFNGAIGKVPGWGIVTHSSTFNETLKSVKMPFVGRDECVRDISRSLRIAVTEDVICAGDKLLNDAVGRGDSGGGLVFEDPKTKAYYLRGIVNIGDRTRKSDIVIFTKLSSYKDLVEKYVTDCRESCRPKHCEPLIPEKLQIICSTPEGKSARCDKPLFNNSIATFSCNSVSYMKIKEQPYNIINCINGEWNKPLVDDFCVLAFPDCGKPVSDALNAKVKNGTETKYGDFPWHAAIYRNNSELCVLEQICGGTLISHKVVVSAAHCFTIKKKGYIISLNEFSMYKIALGKFYRNLSTSGDPLAQIFDVENIEIPPFYLEEKSLYENDIAFVTLKTKAEYSRAVIPICIDISPDNNFEDDQLIKGAKGKVVGWGLTTQRKPSETLLLAEMPFIPKDECIKNIDTTLVSYVRMDKICVGDKSSDVTVCEGDSGGGIVFYHEKTKAYYLRGIVSLGFKSCRAIEYALFTKLSSHRELVQKYLKLE